MVDEVSVRRAVDLQQRGYRLVRWLSTAIETRLLSFGQVHAALSFEEAARAWVLENHAALPSDCRPGLDDVPAFANLFASYLVTSFELVRGERRFSGGSCFCDYCSCVMAASSLRPKKVAPADKVRARRLVVRYVSELARETGVSCGDDEAGRLADDEAWREPLALATYGWRLLRRLEGEFDGPEVLALWRRFAWTRTGAPKRDFVLTAEAILGAEAEVVRRLVAG
jgi:hypothetical protein